MSKTEYFYLDKEIGTGKLLDIKCYNVEKTQEEMDELLSKYNSPDSGPRYHEQVTDPKIIEIINLALKWRSTITLDNVMSALNDISHEVDCARNEIYEYMEDQKELKNEQ